MSSRPDGGEVERGTESGIRWFAMRVRRHLGWARREGVGRLIEEDQLNPVQRVRLAWGKWRWRSTHDATPRAIPVFLVGLQRSGTNMLVRGLEESPEVEVRNENDHTAFHRFRLRSDDVIRRLVTSSGHRYVLFKPLCDSHRTIELLDGLRTPSPGRAIWMYRAVDGRVRSAVAKFGPSNLLVLREIAAGRGLDRWQAQGLSDESLRLVRSFDYTGLSPEDGAALFWYVRNCLFFDLGLDRRDDVFLASYDALIADPDRVMRPLCTFLGFPYSPRLVAHIAERSSGRRSPLDLHPEIRARCEALGDRLDIAAREKARQFAPR